MTALSRRSFLATAAITPLMGLGRRLPSIKAGARPTDIKIEDVTVSYEDYLYRTPIKFGGNIVDRVTLLNVGCVVRTARRQVGQRIRIDAAGQRLVVPVEDAPVPDHPVGHEGACRANPQDHGRLSRDRPSHRHQPRPRPGVPEGGRRDLEIRAIEAGRPHPQAMHASHGKPLRRRHPRRLRQGPQPQLLSDLWARFPRATTWTTTSAASSRANSSRSTSASGRKPACRCTTWSGPSTRSRIRTSRSGWTTACPRP